MKKFVATITIFPPGIRTHGNEFKATREVFFLSKCKKVYFVISV